MGAGDIYAALMSQAGDEESYLAQDPWSKASAGILGMQLQGTKQRPISDTESFLLPLLQGAAGGYMNSLAKDSAREKAYDEYRESPILAALREEGRTRNIGPVSDGDIYGKQVETGGGSDLQLALLSDKYGTPDAPEGWTAKGGRNDMLMLALQEEEARSKEEANQRFLAKYGPEAIAAEAMKAGAIAEAQAPYKKGMTINNTLDTGTSLSKEAQTKLAASDYVIQEATSLASELEKGEMSWAKLQGSKMFAGLDEKGIGSRVKLLVDKLGFASTGATLTSSQEKLYNQVAGGDISAGPKQVAYLLKVLAKAQANSSVNQLEFARTLEEQGVEGVKDRYEKVRTFEDASAPAPPPGYELTGRQDASGNWGIRKTQ